MEDKKMQTSFQVTLLANGREVEPEVVFAGSVEEALSLAIPSIRIRYPQATIRYSNGIVLDKPAASSDDGHDAVNICIWSVDPLDISPLLVE